MHIDLWDTNVAKYLGRFADEGAALAVVKTLIDHYGTDYAADLSLGRVGEDGTILPPLTGSELLARLDELAGEHRREAIAFVANESRRSAD